MAIHPALQIDRRAIADFCRRWEITEFGVFGSALREDFRADSDVDVMVAFAPDARWTLLDILRTEDELGRILHRKADLVERDAVERSENYIRRRHILSTVEQVYAA